MAIFWSPFLYFGDPRSISSSNAAIQAGKYNPWAETWRHSGCRCVAQDWCANPALVSAVLSFSRAFFQKNREMDLSKSANRKPGRAQIVPVPFVV